MIVPSWRGDRCVAWMRRGKGDFCAKLYARAYCADDLPQRSRSGAESARRMASTVMSSVGGRLPMRWCITV
jgi:hypothetical protein